MKKKKSKFNPNRPLPQELTIPSANDKLFKIGLSHFNFGHSKRSLINNPIIILIVNTIVITRSLISLKMKGLSRDMSIYLGNASHFVEVGVQWDIQIVSVCFMSISSLILFYKMYRKGKIPKFMDFFHMLSGFVSPLSLGLTNKVEIRKLSRKAKIMFALNDMTSYIFAPFSGFILYFMVFAKDSSLNEFLLFGIPWSLNGAVWCTYGSNIILSQILCFYLICEFSKQRLRVINEHLLRMKLAKIDVNETNANLLLHSIDRVYGDIKTYNKEYVSQFLFMNSANFLIVFNIFLYNVIFGSFPPGLQLVWAAYSLSAFVAFSFPIHTASVVHSEANRAYPLICSIILTDKTRHLPTDLQYKVFIEHLKTEIIFYIITLWFIKYIQNNK
jgi:hypothetical protein